MKALRPIISVFFIAAGSQTLVNCDLDSGDIEEPRQYSNLLECDTSNSIGLAIDSPATDTAIGRPAPSFENSQLSNVCRIDTQVLIFSNPPVPSTTEIILNGTSVGKFEGALYRRELEGLEVRNDVEVIIKYLGDDPGKKGKTNRSRFYFLRP